MSTVAGVLVEDVDIAKIARSGQCFSIDPLEDGRWSVVAATHRVVVEQIAPCICRLMCSKREFDKVWWRYFDLDCDYVAIRSLVDPTDAHLTAAAEHCAGVRILNQDLWEVLCAFLISQNNNIVRISRSMHALAEALGTRCEDEHGVFFAFPSPKQLAAATDLRRFGVGYREPYLASLAQRVVERSFDIDGLANCPDRDEAHARLLSLDGVGPKVAACIELFGLHWLDSCPIDTWMRKVLDVRYGGTFDWSRYKGCEGIIQQYLFFYERVLAGR